MIRIIRSVKVKPGHLPEALAWAKEVVEYGRGDFRGTEIFIETLGAPGTIHFSTDTDSLAAWEDVAERRMNDENWRQLLRRGSEFMVEGSVRDTVLRST